VGTNASTPVSHGPASGGVDSIIPEFERSPYWAAANEKEKANFERANEHFMKTNKKAFMATNAEEHELNMKADKAIKELRDAKEAIQKEYAKDDPSDYGEGIMDSSDKANEKLYKTHPVKLGGTGSWGPSGTPNKQKWYSDGVISSDAYLTRSGHYLLGQHRRRIGAGYGRRRAVTAASPPSTAADLAMIEEGHPALESAFGDPAKVDQQDDEAQGSEDPILKEGLKGEEATESAGDDALIDANEKKEKDLAAKGEVQASVQNMSPETVNALKDTGAGTDATTDTEGHFTRATTEGIIGSENTDMLKGDGSE